LSLATEWCVIEHAPKIKWLKAPKPPFDFLTFDEAERAVAATDGQWRAMVTVALNTGLRRGELLALRWEDVDLVAGRLLVRRNVWRKHVDTPKSGRLREVPLNETVMTALKAHRHLRGPLVFCKDDGSQLSATMAEAAITRLSKKAGLRKLGWHTLRHTFASHLVMRGQPLKAVQELLGHATVEMTMRYAHLSPEVKRDAVKVLDGKPGSASTPAAP
jgi:integrase